MTKSIIKEKDNWADVFVDDSCPTSSFSFSETQYSFMQGGYRSVTQTIKNLPSAVYSVGNDSQGLYFASQVMTTDDLIRLPDSASDAVVSEIEKFWTLKSQFDSFGFTFKRGILLWGPPGSGKTATVSFIMKQIINAGGIVLLGNDHPTNVAELLHQFRRIEPSRHVVVVLEDIDTLIMNYGESAILSLLDGEDSINNVVFIATTNYPEELDGRVIDRPSRFDRIMFIDVPSDNAREVFLKHKGIKEHEIKKWVSATSGLSIAHVKELIISVHCYGNNFNVESKRLQSMNKRVSSVSLKGSVGFSTSLSFDASDEAVKVDETIVPKLKTLAGFKTESDKEDVCFNTLNDALEKSGLINKQEDVKRKSKKHKKDPLIDIIDELDKLAGKSFDVLSKKKHNTKMRHKRYGKKDDPTYIAKPLLGLIDPPGLRTFISKKRSKKNNNSM